MVAARPSKIIAERCFRGMKEVKIQDPEPKTPVYTHLAPSSTKICDGENVPDPYERRTVYVRKSKYVGEGLFAKRDIQPGEIIAYYIGTVHKFNDVYSQNMTNEEM